MKYDTTYFCRIVEALDMPVVTKIIAGVTSSLVPVAVINPRTNFLETNVLNSRPSLLLEL